MLTSKILIYLKEIEKPSNQYHNWNDHLTATGRRARVFQDKQNVQTGYKTEWLVQMDAFVLRRSTAKRRAPALDNENRLCSPEHNEGGELTWEWHVAIILRGCLSPRQLTGCADTVGPGEVRHSGLLVSCVNEDITWIDCRWAHLWVWCWCKVFENLRGIGERDFVMRSHILPCFIGTSLG